MKKILAIIAAVAQLLPIIIDAIKAIEAALPQSGQGAVKLAMVRELVESAFNAVKDATVAFADVWPAIERLIAKLVAAFNAAGEFKKG